MVNTTALKILISYKKVWLQFLIKQNKPKFHWPLLEELYIVIK